jgi:hypothetical protein
MCYDAFCNRGKEVQPRWERMNDYFRKELQLQQQKKNGDSTFKKKYRYTKFDYLLFLLPTIQASPTCSNYAPTKDNKKVRITEHSTLPTKRRETTPRKMQN